MGYKREIGTMVLGLTLLVVGPRARAEPTEPLTVTQLGDSEAKLLTTVSASIADSSANGDIGHFGRAVSEAVREQQQSIEDRCRSKARGSDKVAARWAWEASCRYRRY
ncbi:MAG: hypothetical protein QOE50_1251 [Sphingomonadales bacterium]|jgi:hypothetical protein|nr:hypothetical protein [Sphingomonadales bacterium]